MFYFLIRNVLGNCPNYLFTLSYCYYNFNKFNCHCRQWLPGEKLEKLGVSQALDEAKLIESRKPADRKAVKKAYQEALHYRKQTHNAAINTVSPL